MTVSMGPKGSEPGPPEDPVFLYLLEQAIHQSLGVFVADVPLALCQRYSPDHRPDLSRLGTEVVDRIAQDWADGHPPRLWVYNRRDHFIVPDDYHALAAAESLRVETVPVYILGLYPKDKISKLEGVLAKPSLLKMFGMAEQ